MGASIGAQAAIAILAQILLALWLDAVDFGVFAFFLSTTFVFEIAAVAGVRTALTRQPRSAVDRLAPAAFRAGLMSSIAAAVALLILSPWLAALFGEPTLVPILAVGSLALPLRTYSTVAIPVLQARLEFRTVALATAGSSVVRYGVAIGLASIGLGAMSLALGIVIGVAVLSLGLVPATIAAIGRSPEPETSAIGVLRMSRSALLGDTAASAASRIDYLVLGLFAPTAVVGVYYFAFQLVARAGELLLGVSRNVLFPVFAQIGGDASRQLRGLRTAAGALAIVGGLGAALLIAVMPVAESVLWRGRWEVAMPAVALLAMALPVQIAVAVPEQLLKARGSFVAWTLLLLARSLGVAIAAILVGVVAGDALSPTLIAAYITAAIVIGGLAEIAALSKLLSFSLGEYWLTILPLGAWFVAVGWAGRLAGDGASADHLVSMLVAGGVVAVGACLAIGVVWSFERAGHSS